MAQYHKIPQNVTTYQGRIIGKFTAKQFVFLAIGVMAVFLIINSPLSKPIKIVLSGGIGFTSLILAVANIDGRSTDFWLSTFLHVVYLPTQMTWRKSAKPPKYLLPSYHPRKGKRGPRKRTTTELNELIRLWQPVRQESFSLSQQEKEKLQRIRKITDEYTTHNITVDKLMSKKAEQSNTIKDSHNVHASKE